MEINKNKRGGQSLKNKDDQIIRKQVSITNGELEVLKEWTPLSDAMHGDALVNGVVRQIIGDQKDDKTDKQAKRVISYG